MNKQSFYGRKGGRTPPRLAAWLGAVITLLFAAQAMAQNFTFSGFLAFQDSEGNVHVQYFEDWGPYTQNVPIPGYLAVPGESASGSTDFHLSCSDPLIGEHAEVDLEFKADQFGSFGFTSPATASPNGFTDGETVTIIDYDIRRAGPGAGVATCSPDRPEVTKTATGAYELAYQWSIDKTVTPEDAEIFFGDTQDFDWKVSVDSTGSTPVNHSVSGEITVRNTLGVPVTVTAVSDVFDGGSGVVVNCDAELPLLLAANAAEVQLTCTYSGDSNGTPGTNTASVTYTRELIAGLVATASDGFDFSGDPTALLYETVNIEDDFNATGAAALGSCNRLGTLPCDFEYSRTLDCEDFSITESGGSGSLSNTATIKETGDSDGATAGLTCYDLDVSKDATPEFTRTYLWTVDKVRTVDDSPVPDDQPVNVSEGQVLAIDYAISVDLDDPGYSDSGWMLSGDITISNNASVSSGLVANITQVVDSAPGISGITVECPKAAPTAGPWTINPQQSLTCSYSGAGDENTEPGTNTATATQSNYARGSDDPTTPIGTTQYQGTASFGFTVPTTYVDVCVDVVDLFSIEGILVSETDLPVLGPIDPSLCVGTDDLPATFLFTGENVGEPDPWFLAGDSLLDPPVCEIELENEAVVLNRDELDPVILANSVVQTRVLNAECVFGCTLTQGYWKTHSEYGPAPYDDTWALLPSGADTPFFISGSSWYEVLWTPPRKGNAYYILAHQFIAARLNVLNEASVTPEVQSALDASQVVFEACGPAAFLKTKGKGGSCGGASADDLIGWASLLDAYNNGYIGPGHCDEDRSSAP